MNKSPALAARRAAGKHLMAVFTHYAKTGIGALEAPLPDEIQIHADALRALDGYDVARLVIERQQFLPFAER